MSGFVMRTDSPTCPISGLFAVNDNQNNWRNKKISANTAVYRYRVDAEYRFEQNYAVGKKTGENPCAQYTVHRQNIGMKPYRPLYTYRK
jgi:hypothetical protein